MKLLSLSLFFLLAPALARADDGAAAGAQALAQLDRLLNVATTHYFEYEGITHEPGRADRKLGLKVWIKGDRRLTEFTEPADLKGTKVLILSPTEMYAYLPAFGKVRRIASHTTDQSAFGMVFTQDDLATQRYGGEYTGTLVAPDKLVLTPKPGSDAMYGKLEITLIKDMGLPSEIKYYSSSGTFLKTETRTGYTCEGKICVPGELKMVDHTKGEMWTKLVRKAWKVNQPFPDDLLSKRSLDR